MCRFFTCRKSVIIICAAKYRTQFLCIFMDGRSTTTILIAIGLILLRRKGNVNSGPCTINRA